MSRFSTRLWVEQALLPFTVLFCFFLSGFLSAGLAVPAQAQQSTVSLEKPTQEKALPDTIAPTSGLAVDETSQYDRSAVYKDTLLHQWATGNLRAPVDGQRLGTHGPQWHSVTADENGVFDELSGGYLYVPVEADSAQTVLLAASGHSKALVNGALRMGDVYDHERLRQPVRLRPGTNHFYFRTGGGTVRVRFVRPTGPLTLAPNDLTLPDLRLESTEPQWGAVRVTNAQDRPDTSLALRVQVAGGSSMVTDVPRIPAHMTRKVGMRIPNATPDTTGAVPLEIALVRKTGTGAQHSQQENAQKSDTRIDPSLFLDSLHTEIDVKGASETHKRTFRSDVDGSVQYYSVVPPADTSATDKPPAMVLSLHGASVDAPSQASTYDPKPNTYIVAPTNRRPFGFDWEDWGRINALKTLRVAEGRYGTDPQRTYLTGHSMGGHGTWHVGSTYPHRFAAIAPFAGYPNLRSYGQPGARSTATTAVEEQIERASNTSDTYGLARNLTQHGVHIVHGSEDRVVPTGHARAMRDTLGSFHKDFAYYEVPGADHWWGSESLDFPPVFDYFDWHEIAPPADQDTLRFTTANPGISARSHWAGIEAQKEPLSFSRVTLTQDLARDSSAGTIAGTTNNVARLSLELGALPRPDTTIVALDGDTLTWTDPESTADRVFLMQTGGRWEKVSAPSPREKGPHRYGPFKQAFQRDVLFVYGTQGTPAENRWAARKARFDAEAFWYRGNGSVDVLPDTAFSSEAHPDRNVIIYGHAEMNRAWAPLLGDSPVQVQRGEITLGSQKASTERLSGTDLGTYFLRPRPETEEGLVGVVAGTGLSGLRAASATRYFRSAAGFPDLLIFGTDMLTDGQDGVRYWGYFGTDWSIDDGDLFGPSSLHPPSSNEQND